MKPFRVFDLSKSEQRVALIVMFVLIAVAFVGYERRARHFQVQPTSATEVKSSPSPAEFKDQQ
jgi:hypothetical protein